MTEEPKAITRNDVTLPLIRKEKEKGSGEGPRFYYTTEIVKYKPGEKEDELGDIDVEATKDNLLNNIIPHLGWDFVAKSLQAKYNLMAQNAVSQAVDKDEEGKPLPGFPVNFEKLIKFHEELSARGESIPEMEARIKELGIEMTKEVFTDMQSGDPAKVLAAQQRGLRISQEMTRLNNQIEARKRGPRIEKKEENGSVTA